MAFFGSPRTRTGSYLRIIGLPRTGTGSYLKIMGLLRTRTTGTSKTMGLTRTKKTTNPTATAPVPFPLWHYFYFNLNDIKYKDTSQRRRDSGWKQLPMTRPMHLTLIFRTQNGAVIVKDGPYKNDSP